MVREVSSPDGMSWRIEIDWVARRIRNPFRRSWQVARQRIAAKRESRRARKREKERARAENDDRGSWLDCVDCSGGADLDDLAIIALAILAVVLLFFLVIWVAPVVWAVLAVLVEFFVVTLAAVAILLWRTLLRRPWRVVVTKGERAWFTDVVGYRTARRRVREVATRLEQGFDPASQGLAPASPAA